MGLFNEIINEEIGKHPLLEIGSTIELIKPHGNTGIIFEGLIKTYPINDVIKTLSRIFDMEIVDKQQLYQIYSKIKMGDNNLEHNGYICKINLNSDVLTFIVGKGEYNKKVLDSYLQKYGYFLSNEREWGVDWSRLQYEKKFDTDVTDLVEKKKYIYHICPDYLKDKILKQGITPHKSKFIGYNNDYRCYFFIEDLGILGFSQWANNFRDENEIETNTYLLIKINTEKIHQDIKFYVDPRMENAVYTLQGISPEAFEDIKEISF